MLGKSHYRTTGHSVDQQNDMDLGRDASEFQVTDAAVLGDVEAVETGESVAVQKTASCAEHMLQLGRPGGGNMILGKPDSLWKPESNCLDCSGGPPAKVDGGGYDSSGQGVRWYLELPRPDYFALVHSTNDHVDSGPGPAVYSGGCAQR